MIKRIYCAQSQSNISRSTKRLGQWIKNHLQSTHQHKFLQSPLTKEIYVQQTPTYEQQFASKITQRRIHIISDTLDHHSTTRLDSVLIEFTNNKFTFNIQISHRIPTFKSPILNNWDEYLSSKPEWMQQLTRNTKHNLKMEPLIYHLQTEVPLIILSDGAKGD